MKTMGQRFMYTCNNENKAVSKANFASAAKMNTLYKQTVSVCRMCIVIFLLP